ncbi:hypothetical protein HYQ46_000652 [Verticillium longisporum]|nr:hypothetical protein HYQ46_000652 [Verticillium longisporum]
MITTLYVLQLQQSMPRRRGIRQAPTMNFVVSAKPIARAGSSMHCVAEKWGQKRAIVALGLRWTLESAVTDVRLSTVSRCLMDWHY